MMLPRSLTTLVAVCAAFSTIKAFSPSAITSSRPKSLLQVGTLPNSDPFGSNSQSNNVHEEVETTALPAGVHAPITTINSPQELAQFLHQDDRICVIKFHAAWCKSCQRFGLKFQGMANQKTDWIDDSSHHVVKEGQLRFGSIEFGANTGMCRTLGIKRLPTVQIYQMGQKLDGFPCGPKKFPLLQEKVAHYLGLQESNVSMEEMLQQGDELMSSVEVAGVLEQLIEQEVNGSLESAKTKANQKSGSSEKKWWNIMP